MTAATILNATIAASMFLTASFVIFGLARAIVQCWIDSAPKTSEHLETAQIIQEVSKTVLSRSQPLEPLAEVTEETIPDFWTLPINPVEKAFSTVKTQSTKPEILLLAAPKKLTKTEINKAKKDQLEAWCQFWNVATGTVTAMRTELKRVAC